MRLLFAPLISALICWPLVLWADEEARQIFVTGEGRVAAEPDMAVLSLGVTREARLAGEAMSAVSAEVAKVLAVIEASGVAARDVQTASVSLSPRWDHRQNNTPPRVIGYVASNTLTVRVRDLAKLGGLMDKVIGSGANQMNGLSFTLADPRPLQDEARQLAVADGAAKAMLLAEAAKVALGPLQSLSEAGGGRPTAMAMRTEAFAADVPIAAGEVDIRIHVNMVFGIGD